MKLFLYDSSEFDSNKLAVAIGAVSLLFGAVTLQHRYNKQKNVVADPLKKIADGDAKNFISYINALIARGDNPADLHITGKSLLCYLAEKYMYTLSAIAYEQKYIDEFGGSDDDEPCNDNNQEQLNNYYQKLSFLADFYEQSALRANISIRSYDRKVITFTVQSIFASVAPARVRIMP